MPVTPNLHLELFAPLGVGWREDATAGALLDENMMILDAAIGGGSALFQLNDSDLLVQDKINFTDDGILQIIEGASGELHWDSSGVITTAVVTAASYTDGAVNAEAVTRAAADATLAPKARLINTTAPLTGGGDLSADRTLAISDFVGDSGSGGVKGAVPAPAAGDAVANKYLKANGSWTALAAADIPNLAASKITSGVLALARGGNTFAALGDLIYGGAAAAPTVLTGQVTTTKKYLSQTGDGANSAAPAWAQIAAADLTGLAAIATTGKWSDLQNASADLTLANGAFATTFNQTSAAVWKWANTTAATAAGVVSPSPVNAFGARVFSSGVDTSALYNVQHVLVPTTALSFAITNAVESAGFTVTLTIGTHTLVAGNWITISAISTAAFTFLNTLNARIVSVTGTTIVFQDPTSHGAVGSAACNGTTTQIPTSNLVLAQAGSVGDSYVSVPQGVQGAATGGWGLTFTGATAGFNMSGATLALASNATGTFPALRFYAGSALQLQLTTSTSSSVQVAGFIASATANCVEIESNITTTISQPGISLCQASSFIATAAGTQYAVAIGNPNAGVVTNGICTFAPTSGASDFVALLVRPVINQTGGASGHYTALKIQGVETALGSASGHKLLDMYAGATGTQQVYAIDNLGAQTFYSGEGAQWTHSIVTVLLPLSTVALTTDTSNMLFQNSIIEAVVVRVTTAITVATSFTVGDNSGGAGTASRFATGVAVAAGSTSVGLLHWSGASTTLALGPSQPTTNKVRITAVGGQPGAGVVRITVFFRTFIPPQS